MKDEEVGSILNIATFDSGQLREQQEVSLNVRPIIIGSSRNNQWIRRWGN